MHDAGQFVVSSLAVQLSSRQILAEPVIRLSGMDIRPFLIGNTAYPSRPYMLRNYNLRNPAMVDQNRYVQSIYLYFYFLYNVYIFVFLIAILLNLLCGSYRFDSSVNSGRVVIEQAFGSLKNRWRILKGFNMSVDKAALVTLTCCVLHNYCEIHRQRVPLPAHVRLQRDPYVGFHVGRMQLPCEGLAAKLAGEAMRDILFASWLERNPR